MSSNVRIPLLFSVRRGVSLARVDHVARQLENLAVLHANQHELGRDATRGDGDTQGLQSPAT